jgi:hypothetical protein
LASTIVNLTVLRRLGVYQEMMPEARPMADRQIRKLSLDSTLSGRPELHCEAQVTDAADAIFTWTGQGELCGVRVIPAVDVVDGTFIWTPSHDQRPCSFSTAPRGCDPCRRSSDEATMVTECC